MDYIAYLNSYTSFPDGLAGKESTCNVGDRKLVQSLGREDPWEKETHSSVLAWEIPWTEEPGQLQSMESQNDQTQPSD